MSFRGNKCDEEFNCEQIAAYFKGGGHKMASGCIISENSFYQHFKIIKSINLNSHNV